MHVTCSVLQPMSESVAPTSIVMSQCDWTCASELTLTRTTVWWWTLSTRDGSVLYCQSVVKVNAVQAN